MLHVIDLRAEDDETKNLYDHVFKPFAEIILDLKLYQDRTVKKDVQCVANQSSSSMAKMIYKNLENVKSLNSLKGDLKDFIFTYWFRIQIESKIFILDPNHQYLAYNGRISEHVKSNIEGVLNSQNFLRFEKTFSFQIINRIAIWPENIFIQNTNF